MDRDQERRHLETADVHIAKSKDHIASQRSIITKLRLANAPLDTAKSMLSALEGSLRVFERHRELILDKLGTNEGSAETLRKERRCNMAVSYQLIGNDEQLMRSRL